jgi:hypothetical protein
MRWDYNCGVVEENDISTPEKCPWAGLFGCKPGW